MSFDTCHRGGNRLFLWLLLQSGLFERRLLHNCLVCRLQLFLNFLRLTTFFRKVPHFFFNWLFRRLLIIAFTCIKIILGPHLRLVDYVLRKVLIQHLHRIQNRHLLLHRIKPTRLHCLHHFELHQHLLLLLWVHICIAQNHLLKLLKHWVLLHLVRNRGLGFVLFDHRFISRSIFSGLFFRKRNWGHFLLNYPLFSAPDFDLFGPLTLAVRTTTIAARFPIFNIKFIIF